MKTDIRKPEDVTKLIKTFYDRLLTSPIRHHFSELDLPSHLPRVEQFWNAMIFPEIAYTQNLMERHAALHLVKEDFRIWQSLFWETVDELFSGPQSELVKNRAASMSYLMQKRFSKD